MYQDFSIMMRYLTFAFLKRTLKTTTRIPIYQRIYSKIKDGDAVPLS